MGEAGTAATRKETEVMKRNGALNTDAVSHRTRNFK